MIQYVPSNKHGLQRNRLLRQITHTKVAISLLSANTVFGFLFSIYLGPKGEGGHCLHDYLAETASSRSFLDAILTGHIHCVHGVASERKPTVRTTWESIAWQEVNKWSLVPSRRHLPLRFNILLRQAVRSSLLINWCFTVLMSPLSLCIFWPCYRCLT